MITAFVKKELNTAEVNTFAKWLFNYFKKMQKQPPEVFSKNCS